ncbi:MarR family transcriptional regulator [Pseudomonas sp. CM25]|uniref:MarR family winged helix-turn-helix transcriptional regulator n=1 Tax=Pseudomonas sp. CM25 TaxID=2738448 RepID=UPI00155648CF|nr:MarR family transcriptional regulator [Pseudomonas sp. CM25]NQD55659.1 MarR family transcriptional regulator [Pseudomonas sp. CM25]
MLKDRSSTDEKSPSERLSPNASKRSRKASTKSVPQGADCRTEQPTYNDNELDLLSGTLGYAIKRAQMRSYEVLFSILGPNALTPGRMTALSLIGLQPGIIQSALAEQLKINRASMVKVIDALEALGFVERCATEGDRRSYALRLTLVGNQALQKLHQQIDEYEKAISSTLAKGERKLLMELLEKVAAEGRS